MKGFKLTCNLLTTEIRKEDRQSYTPRSITQILSGLLRYIHEEDKNALNIMNAEAFPKLHKCLDGLFKELHSQGIGTVRKQAEAISFSEEQTLWDSGVLNVETPDGLFNAVFYYNGLNLVLRGGDEHRNLKLSQFKIKTVPHPQFPSQETECVVYTEHGSKNRSGGSKQLNLDNKVITQYAKPHLGNRCHIQLLKKYFSKLPQTA